MNLEDAEALARKITERRAKMKQQQQTGSFATSEPPKRKPSRTSEPPQKVRLDSDPGAKAVIIILSIIVAAIVIWVLALGPYMRMGS